MIHAIADLERCLAVFALHAVWQVPLLAGVAWFAVRVGRPHPRTAHALWYGTLILCVALPLCSSLQARQAALQAQRDAANAVLGLEGGEYQGVVPVLARESAWQRLLRRHLSRHGLHPFFFVVPQTLARDLAGAYLIVATFFAVQLLLAWRRMRAIVQGAQCQPMPPGFVSLLHGECERRNLGVPAARVSDEVAGPALAGVFRPVLLLPARSVLHMNAGEARAVLAHELAHLQRRDPALQALCSLLLLPLAFHPAAWWTARHLRQTREMACDAEAAASMGSRTVYARALLGVAERIGSRRAKHGMLSFFSSGLFGAALELFNGGGAMEERMQMLMKSQHPAERSGRVVRLAACVSLGTAAVLAAGMLQVRPALAVEPAVVQKAFPHNQTSPSAVLETNENTLPHLLVGHDAVGRIEAVHHGGNQAERTAMSENRRQVATARQAAAVTGDAMAAVSGRASSSAVPLNPQATQFLARNEAPALVSVIGADKPLKVPSSVMAANATHREPPVYPAEAKEKKIQGAVVLHAVITKEGAVEQLSVITSPDPMLSNSATTAVQKWIYKPYLLNGNPVDVETTVTVNYSLSQ